jgi:phosphoribosylanthranilate isomerase
MDTKIKICGIRSLESAQVAVEHGADFLGLNFVPSSKRFIDLNTAKIIAKNVKGRIALVGIFQNQPIEEINTICEVLNLDFVQLHGDETEDFCKQIKVSVIKAFGLQTVFNVHEISKHLERYNIPFYLIDREKRGEGEVISLSNAAELAQCYPLFFSGGLHPENVAEVVKTVKPFAVDVAGGIETSGKEDLEKIKQFITLVKEVQL